MAINKLITSEGNVQFIFGDTGKIINVHPFHIYTSFNEDTVSFILIGLPKSTGLAIFTSRAEDLEVNGEIYSFDDLPDALAEAFAIAGAQMRYEVVDELPETGQTNTIYLVPKETGSGFDEYIYVRDTGEWELIGDTDIELARYLKKEDFNTYSAATKLKIDYLSGATDYVSGAVDTEVSRATSAETALQTAIDNEASARTEADTTLQTNIDNEASARTSADTALQTALDNEISARTSADTALQTAIDNEISARTEADSALSDKIDTKFDASAITAYSTTVEVGNAIEAATSGKVNTSDFNTYSGAVETALGNKFDASGITAYSTSQEVTAEIEAATSGKVDTTAFTTYSASVETALSGKQGALTAGRGVDITSDVISFDFPISAGTGVDSLLMSGSGNTASGKYSVAFGKLNTVSGECGVIMGNRNTSNNFAESAFGQKNVSRTGDASSFGHSGNTIFTVGNGVINVQEGIDANHNAFEIRGNGDIYIADTNATGGYYEKPMIKLQDAIGGGSITIDPTLDSGSTNAVANSAITEAFENVEDRLGEDEEVWGAALNELNASISAVNDSFSAYSTTVEMTEEITAAVSGKQDTLIAGDNITISGNVISATGGGGEVSSAITSGDTNAVAGGVLWDELRLPAEGESGLTLEWENHDEGYTTNYPSGQSSKITIYTDVYYGGNNYYFRNSGDEDLGFIYIAFEDDTAYVSDYSNCTYTMSGNVITVEYPSIAANVDHIYSSYDNNWTTIAYINSTVYTPLINQVSANTATLASLEENVNENEEVTARALIGLSEADEVTARALVDLNDKFGGLKLKKITQAAYDALTTKDANTLYIISD